MLKTKTKYHNTHKPTKKTPRASCTRHISTRSQAKRRFLTPSFSTDQTTLYTSPLITLHDVRTRPFMTIHPTTHKNSLNQEILLIHNASFFSGIFDKFKSKVHALSGEYDQFAEEQHQKQKLVQRVSMKPSTPEEQAQYDLMMQNNHARYQAGEFEAMIEKRKQQLSKDALESDVFHIDPDTILNKIDQLNAQYSATHPHANRNEAKEIKIVKNPDGSISLSTEDTMITTSVKDDENAQNSAQTGSKSAPQVDVTTGEFTAIGQIEDPRMLISFICDMCKIRNVKSIPKRSYDRGVILIRCKCTADHLISDNLGWFDDTEGLTIERILKEEKGEKVFKASVLDLNKRVQDLDGNQQEEITETTISPEMYNKIQETLTIAREEDLKMDIKFKHFYHEDKLAKENEGKKFYLPLPEAEKKSDDEKH